MQIPVALFSCQKLYASDVMRLECPTEQTGGVLCSDEPRGAFLSTNDIIWRITVFHFSPTNKSDTHTNRISTMATAGKYQLLCLENPLLDISVTGYVLDSSEAVQCLLALNPITLGKHSLARSHMRFY